MVALATASGLAVVLILAAYGNRRDEVVMFLLKNGADARIKNNNGTRAIDFVKKKPKFSGAEVLKQLEKASR